MKLRKMSEKKIKFYSKEGCSPCRMYGGIAKSRLPESYFEIVKFGTDEELISVMNKFGVKHVPFMVINDNSVIHANDVADLVWAIAKHT